MLTDFRLICFTFLASCLFWHCAQPVPPQGGPRDRQPPAIDSARSTPNFKVNFTNQPIKLVFDEWIQLKDQFTQIVVSPPLETAPQIKSRGKEIDITFARDEEFAPNTTYTINFGSSIRDLTEGNVLDGYKYIFSTGTYIDSLAMEGKVLHAESHSPAEGVLVILHAAEADSAIFRDRPMYFAKTDSSGAFLLENLRSDSFRVYALVDLNLNYKFDQAEEKVGFYPDPVVTRDTVRPYVRFAIFTERQDLKVTTRNVPFQGYSVFGLNRVPIQPNLRAPDAGPATYTWKQEADTLKIWCIAPGPDTISLEYLEDTAVVDTLTCPCFHETGEANVPKVSVRSASRNLLPGEAWAIDLTTPVASFDRTALELVASDSITLDNWTIVVDTADSRRVQVGYPWKETVSYTFRMHPDGIVDLFGATTDSVFVRASGVKLDTRSNLLLKISDLDSTLQYVLEIRQEKRVIDIRLLNGSTNHVIQLKGLVPKPLELRLIRDANGNGVWDPGKVFEGVLAEEAREAKVESLRAGWDVEFSFPWKN